MRFLHSSIQRSQKILKCIPLDNSTDTCDILLIYSDYAQVLNVENSDEIVKLSALQVNYPLPVHIMWCYIVGDHIAAVTRNGRLLMLEKTPPFKLVEDIKLTENKCPTTIPIAHCAVSTTGEYLVSSAFRGTAIGAQFDCNDHPTLQNILLPKFYVIGVVATQDPSVFVFLVEFDNKPGHKYVIHFSMDDLTEASRSEVPADAYAITSVFDEEGYSTIILFTESELRIMDMDAVIELPARVHSWFATAGGELVIQCLNNQLYGVSRSGTPSLVPKGTLPLISTFCYLENGLLLCVSDGGDSFFVPVWLSSEHSFVDDTSTLDFELLPKTSIPLTPYITSAMFNDRSLIVASGGGETNPQYMISSYQNTLPFSIEREDISTSSLRDLERPIKLFSFDGESIFASSPTMTKCIRGDFYIENEESILIEKFDEDYIQVHKRGIRKLASGETWSCGDDVVAAACNSSQCAVVFADSTVRVFDNNLNVLQTEEITGVNRLAVCGNYLAVAAESTSGGNSTVTLYDIASLRPTDDVGQLAGLVHSMLFIEDSMELYISTVGGAVSRWIIGDKFSKSCAKIYDGGSPAELLPFMDYVLIVSDSTYVFDGQQLLAMKIDNLVSVCCGSSPNELYLLDNTLTLYRANVCDLNRDLTQKTMVPASMPRKMITHGPLTFVISRSRNPDGNVTSALIQIEDDPTSHNLSKRTSQFPAGFGLVSICVAPFDYFFVGAIAIGQCCIMIMKFEEQLKHIKRIELPSPPLAMTAIRDSAVIVGAGKSLMVFQYVDEQWEKASTFIAPVPTQVAFIEVTSHGIWVADKTNSLIYYEYMESGPLAILNAGNPVVVDSEPRQVSAMCIMDECTAAVGDRFGKIVILGLPDDVRVGSPWRATTIPHQKSRAAGRFVKMAVFSVNECVTSLMISQYSRALYYTTLLGQIGSFIPLSDESEFNMLAHAELLTMRMCASEFGLTVLRDYDPEQLNVVTADILDLVEQLKPESQKVIEDMLMIPTNALAGLLCRLKERAKF